jgi:hypothetical protein
MTTPGYYLNLKGYHLAKFKDFLKTTQLLKTFIIILMAVTLGACVKFDAPARSYAVDLVDLNGNGYLDAFVVNGRGDHSGEMNTVWFNDGSGVFTDSGQRLVDPAHSNDGRALALFDLTGDGHIAAAVANSNGYDELWISDGEGSFNAGLRLMSSDPDTRIQTFLMSTHAVAAGDFNGDGLIDIAFADTSTVRSMEENLGSMELEEVQSDPFIRMWLNEGEGAVGSGPRYGPYAVIHLAVGDLNGNGHLDLAVGVREGSSLILFNDGQGNFFQGSQAFPTENINSLSLGDLDGDGSLDLAFATRQGVEIWFNGGNAQFIKFEQAFGTLDVHKVEAADLNGDGHLDLFMIGETRAEAWLNDGQGGFSLYGEPLKYNKYNALALGDLNGSGSIDVIAFHYDRGYRVWFNDGEANFEED